MGDVTEPTETSQAAPAAPGVDTAPVCMEPECQRNRGTLWGALGLAQRTASALEKALESLDESQEWRNEQGRILNEFVAEFTALAARLNGAQRRVLADALRATGQMEKAKESQPT